MFRFFILAAVLVTLSSAGCENEPVVTAPDPSVSEQQLSKSRANCRPVRVYCGQVITESVALANDLCDCPGNGLVVAADDVVIDGRGHVVDGLLAEVTYGILIDGHTGITVKNIKISEFTIGVGISNSSDTRVLNSRITMNDLDGVLLMAAHETDLALNRFVGNGIAINVTDSNGNRIEHNRIVDPRFGNAIQLSGVARSEVVNNTIQGGGLNLQSATESRIERNRITGGPVAGYSIRGQSHHNVLSNNRVTGVSGDGFLVFGVSPVFAPAQNKLIGNRASGNTGDGFRVSGAASATMLIRNESERNGGFGFRDATSGSGTAGTANVYDRNRCQSNVAGPSAPPDLCRCSETP